jgi:hemolysin activation/secretion protein
LLALCAGACVAHGAGAAGQAEPQAGQAFDVNSVRPGQPGSERLPQPATSGAEAAVGEDVATYRVSRFLIEYRGEHPQHPPIEALSSAKVALGASPEGYVAPRAGVATTTIAVEDVTIASPGVFSPGALQAVARAIVGEVQKGGLASILVQIDPDQIDPETGEDKRPNASGDLRFIVWAGVIGQVRTIASGERLQGDIDAGRTSRVDSDDRVHARVRAQSPVATGELVGKGMVDDFVHRLNRHPGRRVDVAVGPGEQEGQVALDYVVYESKPWSLYAQLSNTGTDATSEWRQRFGFVHNQLTAHDDVLRIDYVTAAFDDSNSVLGSYEYPLMSDVLRAKLYGSFGEYQASDVGIGGEAFSGQNYTVGGELIGNVYQQGRWFVDAFGGLRWQSVRVTNDLFFETGKEQYVVPSIGARMERVTDVAQTFASVGLEYQNASLSGTDGNEFDNLGRPNADDDWFVLKFDFFQSYYLEPLFSERYWGTGDKGLTTLAHEVHLSARGQYGFNSRLIPNEQEVVGGLFSVRGYPESVAAGDTAVIGTFEYRFHFPRALAISNPGHIGSEQQKRWNTFFGDDFRYAPQEPFGQTDWDLIFKAFLDVGSTDVSSALPGEEAQTLIGAGLGVEYQLRRNLTARLDWGLALHDVNDPANNVEVGDNRFHFLLSVMY